MDEGNISERKVGRKFHSSPKDCILGDEGSISERKLGRKLYSSPKDGVLGDEGNVSKHKLGRNFYPSEAEISRPQDWRGMCHISRPWNNFTYNTGLNPQRCNGDLAYFY